jgi:hypothetical protein
MALHSMIYQVKASIRTMYSSVSDFTIERHLDTFYYRIDRTKSKKIYLIIRYLEGSNLKKNHPKIICS